jgi:hypothetical protein
MTVDEHAQRRKQLGGPLDLVEHDEPVQRFERKLGFGQSREVGGALGLKSLHKPPRFRVQSASSYWF